ncbi:protein RTE1-HOMOLOG-like [Iris pallida]|uniref:Protein RTE1-HOMOLOG-like n=1 Tax=Iris pallida TaxID=29817 RepID=A0AAX6GNT4_IRIPA|nr:protein RTE1-HOMOLOG-like [Iris pallida]
MPKESEASEDELMLNRTFPLGPIDPNRARFPCCIVWTPLPFISWFIPFIGHMGICREDGVILDFAGPNFVCVDHFTFGAVTRYIQLNREKCCFSHSSTAVASRDGYRQTEANDMITWDDALRKSTQEFQHRPYNLFTCNCHSFVANNLNRMAYSGQHGWNVVNLAGWMFLKGTWVSKTSLVRSFMPFAVLLCLGLLVGSTNFFIIWIVFSFVLVGWFVVGTYCFRNLIQL